MTNVEDERYLPTGFIIYYKAFNYILRYPVTKSYYYYFLHITKHVLLYFVVIPTKNDAVFCRYLANNIVITTICIYYKACKCYILLLSCEEYCCYYSSTGTMLSYSYDNYLSRS